MIHIKSFQDRLAQAPVSAAAAVAAVVATFSKQFLPFYHLGSTQIFAAAAVISAMLVVPLWMGRFEHFAKAKSAAAILGGIWAFTGLSYLLFARNSVPPTYLLGFFLFSGFFLLIGIAASYSLRSVARILVAVAAIYLFYLAWYVIEMGFLFPPQQLVRSFGFPGGFGDIFNLSSDPEAYRMGIYVAQYQNVGRFLALGAIGYLMLLGDGRLGRRLFWLVSAATFALLLWIGARTAVVGFSVAAAAAILIARRMSLKWMAAFMVAAALLAVVLVALAKVAGGIGIPAIDRTVTEFEDPLPQFRGPILANLLGVIQKEPWTALLGRGFGMFPVELGKAPPDWLIGRGISAYPHNVLLEALYEAGIGAFVLLAMLLYLPMGRAIAIWPDFTREESFVVQLYLFHLTSLQISGALAYSYDFYFILGLTIGTLTWQRASIPSHRRAIFPSRRTGMAAPDSAMPFRAVRGSDSGERLLCCARRELR